MFIHHRSGGLNIFVDFSPSKNLILSNSALQTTTYINIGKTMYSNPDGSAADLIFSILHDYYTSQYNNRGEKLSRF